MFEPGTLRCPFDKCRLKAKNFLYLNSSLDILIEDHVKHRPFKRAASCFTSCHEKIQSDVPQIMLRKFPALIRVVLQDLLVDEAVEEISQAVWLKRRLMVGNLLIDKFEHRVHTVDNPYEAKEFKNLEDLDGVEGQHSKRFSGICDQVFDFEHRLGHFRVAAVEPLPDQDPHQGVQDGDVEEVHCLNRLPTRGL